MGAGEDDGVNPVAVGSIEQRLGGRANRLHADLLTRELRFRQLDQLWRAVADDCAVGREPSREIVDIGLADGRLGSEDSDHARFRHFGRGLDCRNGAHDRKVERGAGVVERDRGRGVAGNDRKAGMESLNEAPEQSGNAARKIGLAALAVGEAGAVRRIDDRRVGQELESRREDRQSADP